MKSLKLNSLSLVLALSGFCISVFQTSHFFDVRNGSASFKSFCTFGSFNCEAIELSRFAELFFGVPLSSLGAAWYLALFVILWMARDPFKRRQALICALFGAGLSVLLSIAYLFVMVAVIGKLCLLCLIIDGINLSLFALILGMKPFDSNPGPEHKAQQKTVLTIVGVSVVIIPLFLQILKPESPSNTMIQSMLDEVISSPALDVPIRAHNPVSGNPNAPLTLVKFSDFQCPACKHGARHTHPLLLKYPDKIKFVFKHYPLDMNCNRKVNQPMHGFACQMARFSVCAEKKSKFWGAFETFFEHQDIISRGQSGFDELILRAGLSDPDYKTCAASQESLDLVKQDIEDGIALGVESTPTFFLNGHIIKGSFPTPVWSQLVESMLAKTSGK